MLLARVEGNVVATRKHPSLEGWRLVVCQPIGASGEPEGAPQVAIDPHGAGMHQQVVIWASRQNVELQQLADNWFPLRFVRVRQ